jgi:hypothetical protein
MKRTTGPQNKICPLAYFISKWRGPEDHKTRFAIEHISSPNKEDRRTTKQDLHLSILYLQMERTAEQQKIFALELIISPNKEDHRTLQIYLHLSLL